MSIDSHASYADLVAVAIQAAQTAYIPYSHYAVGAALQCDDGTIVTGCNIENAAYGASICAERTAVVKAVSEGKRNFTAIAVATANGGSPCGTCRQVLREFAPDIPVIITDFKGQFMVVPLGELLPHSFGPEKLG